LRELYSGDVPILIASQFIAAIANGLASRGFANIFDGKQ
jgi:hypothetical protein